MANKLTKEEFISRSQLHHTNQYSYSKVQYVNNSTKVIIQCVKHDSEFLQSPNKHMAGQGCPICRYEKASKTLQKSTEEFIKSARNVHNSKYSYAHTNYQGVFEDVDILCNTHNTVFKQKPTNHLSGSGCPLCAQEKIDRHIKSLVLTNAQFAEKATEVHGDLYDYSNTVYTKSAEYVDIWCNRHQGSFRQTANSHLAGIGCASCANTGYSTNKKGYLYILTCGDMTKIGITNISPTLRAKTISKKYGATFTVKNAWEFIDGRVPDEIETKVLRVLRGLYQRPEAVFEGSSECFLNVDNLHLINIIQQNIYEKQETN